MGPDCHRSQLTLSNNVAGLWAAQLCSSARVRARVSVSQRCRWRGRRTKAHPERCVKDEDELAAALAGETPSYMRRGALKEEERTLSNVLSKLLRKTCLHEQTIVVRSTHVERTVCETCGHISFTIVEESTLQPAGLEGG